MNTEYVGFWARFLAFIVDSIVVMIVLLPITYLFPLGDIDMSLLMSSDPIASQEYAREILANFSIQSLASAIAILLLWNWIYSSPGKLIFKGYIVDHRTLGPPTKGQLIIRYLSYFLSLLAFGLGFIWIGLDKRKQGWHDKLAGTVVIKGKPHYQSEETTGDVES